MASFKYKNMQQFVKQTIHPYIVNVVLLIKDAFKHITRLDKEIADTNTYITTKVEPRISVHDDIVGLPELAKKDANGNYILDENGNIQLNDNFKYKNDNHETRLQDLETIIGKDFVALSKFNDSTDNHETRLDGHDSALASLEADVSRIDKNLATHAEAIGDNKSRIAALESSSNSHVKNKNNPHNTKYTNLSDVYISTLPPSSNTTYDVWDQLL